MVPAEEKQKIDRALDSPLTCAQNMPGIPYHGIEYHGWNLTHARGKFDGLFNKLF
jgi:hypothetical protein